MHRLAGNLGALPPALVDEIVERTDGVPLFLEELTKAVVEAGADRGNAPISAVPPSSRLAAGAPRSARPGGQECGGREANALKEVVAELTLENRLAEKNAIGAGRTKHEISRNREAGDHPAG